MVKKFLKKALSIVLVAAMLITTFSCLDVGLLKSFANVYVNPIEDMRKTLPTQYEYAPEAVWLKPTASGGTADFQYVAHWDVNSGEAFSGVKSFDDGQYDDLEFEYHDATEVKLYVNRVYAKGAYNTPVTGFKLNINGSSPSGSNNITYANCSASSVSVASGATVIAQGTDAFDVHLNGGSLANIDPGTTYFIEWVYRYVVNGTAQVCFLYTAIYAPSTGSAGMVGSDRRVRNSYTTVTLLSMGMITGAMKYSGGNYKLNKEITDGTYSYQSVSGYELSKLSIGQDDSYEYKQQPNGGFFIAGDTFKSSTSDFSGTAAQKADRHMYKTNWGTGDNVPSLDFGESIDFANTNVGFYIENRDDDTGSRKNNGYTYGTSAGVAYIVADTSRFSDYSQIPNLAATSYIYSEDGNTNVKRIKSINHPLTDDRQAEPYVYANVDQGSCGGGTLRGPYNFNGKITGGFKTIAFTTFSYHSGLVDDNELYQYLTVGLHTTAVDKSGLRQTYNAAANSHISSSTYGDGYAGQNGFYEKFKDLSEKLTDPQQYSESVSGFGIGDVTSKENDIKEDMLGADGEKYVYFYVPEAIYLNAGGSTFTYIIDDTHSINTTDGTASYSVRSNKNAMSNSSNTGITFYYKDAVSVTVSASGYSTITLKNSSGNNISGTTFTGTTTVQGGISAGTKTGLSAGSDSFITWTATYTDNKGVTKTATAYTAVYAPQTNVLATGSLGRYKSSRDSRASIENITVWATGFNSFFTFNNNGNITYGEYAVEERQNKGPVHGTYDQSVLTTNTVTKKDLGRNDTAGTGQLAYNSTNDGYYYGIVNNDCAGHTENHNQMGAWNYTYGELYVDSSRYTSIGYIPYFRVGLDIHEYWCGDEADYCQIGYGITKSVATSGSTSDQQRAPWVNKSANYSNCYNNTDVFKGEQFYGERKEKTDLYNLSELAVTTGDVDRQFFVRGRAWVNNNDYIGVTNSYLWFVYHPNNMEPLRQALEYAMRMNNYLTPDMAPYFDSTLWNKVQNEYEAAKEMLALPNRCSVTVNGTNYPGPGTVTISNGIVTGGSGLAYNLCHDIETLLSASSSGGRRERTATQYNIGLIAQNDGTFLVAPIGEALDYVHPENRTDVITKSFTSYDKLEFTAEHYGGYNYVGYIDGTSWTKLRTASKIWNLKYNQEYDTLPEGNIGYGALFPYTVNNYKNKLNSDDYICYDHAANRDYTYYFFYILNPDVLYDNYFDFDESVYDFDESDPNNVHRTVTVDGKTETIYDSCFANDVKNIITDYAKNKVTFTSVNWQTSGEVDPFLGETKRIKLIKGHTYRVTYNFETDKPDEITSRLTIIPYATLTEQPVPLHLTGFDVEGNEITTYYEHFQSGDIFTVSEDYEYYSLRFGMHDSDQRNVHCPENATVSYSNVVVQDISEPGIRTVEDDVTAPPLTETVFSPLVKGGAVPISLPSGMFRTGYAFDGWYQDHILDGTDEHAGNGTGSTAPTSLTTSKPGNLHLWSKWKLKGEVIYDNIFDFDQWAQVLYISKHPDSSNEYIEDGTLTKGYGSNSIKIINQRSEINDVYTRPYQPLVEDGLEIPAANVYKMEIIPGHTYRILADVKAGNTEITGSVQAFMFKNADLNDPPASATWSNEYYSGYHKSADPEPDNPEREHFADTIEAKGTGNFNISFTAPADAHYMTVRFGLETAKATMYVSNIYIYDISVLYEDELIPDDKTPADPRRVARDKDEQLGELATQFRTGYTMVGWYKEMYEPDLHPDENHDVLWAINENNEDHYIPYEETSVKDTETDEGNLHLYSWWKANTYRVYYDMNDEGSENKGVNHPDNCSKDSTTGEPLNYTVATFGYPFEVRVPSRKGYRFVGWTLEGENPFYKTNDNKGAVYGSSKDNCTNPISDKNYPEDAFGTDGNPVWLSNLCDRDLETDGGNVTLKANWVIDDLQIGYDNLFRFDEFAYDINTGIVNMNSSDDKIYANVIEKEFTIKYGNTTNDSFTNYTNFDENSYKIPVDADAEYLLSYEQSSSSVFNNNLQVTVMFYNASGNPIYLSNLYGDYAYRCIYDTDMSSDGKSHTGTVRHVDQETPLNWALDLNNAKVIYSGLSMDDVCRTPAANHYGDKCANIMFKTPANAAYVTIGFAAAADSAFNNTSIKFKNIILRPTHPNGVTDMEYPVNYPKDSDTYKTSTADFSVTDSVDPTLYGYNFAGWYADAACTTLITSVTPADYPLGITAYSKWTTDEYEVIYDADNENVDPSSMPGNKTKANSNAVKYTDSTFDVVSEAIPLDSTGTKVFYGWVRDDDTSGTIYYPGDPTEKKSFIKTLYSLLWNIDKTDKPGEGVTFTAQWVDVSDAVEAKASHDVEDELKQLDMEVVTGIDVDDSGKVTSLSEKIKKFADVPYSEYEDAIDDFDGVVADAQTTVNNNTKDNVENAKKALTDAADNLSSNLVEIDDDYYNNFKIKKDGKTTDCTLGDMNLNKYKVATLDAAQQALKDGDTARFSNVGTQTARKAFDKVTVDGSQVYAQKALNDQVEKMAREFINQEDKDVSIDPVYNVYESNGTEPSDITAKLGAAEGVYGINYVYSGKGNYTYYCYTCNPITTITLDVVQNATLTTENVAYPTRSDFEVVDASTTSTYVDPEGEKEKGEVIASEISVTNDNYRKYLTSSADNGYGKYYIGNTYTGTVNSDKSYTGADYYNKKSVVALTSRFADNDIKKTVSYKLSSYDDSFIPNYATKTKLACGKSSDYATTATGSTAVTPENTLTIIVEYKPRNGFSVTTDQVNIDTWLGQFHIFRTAGGASNWEFPTVGDTVYTVYDSAYSNQNDLGSFTYTFMADDERFTGFAPLADNEWNSKQSDSTKYIALASNKKLTGSTETNLDIVRDYINKNKAEIVGDAFTGKNVGGSGLGYFQVYGWSTNYYPESLSYTYFHLIDRWGNLAEGIAPVPNIDSIKAGMKPLAKSKMKVSEVGGSGLASMSLGKNFEIITDDNSTFENNVFRTAGNTITLKTGAANTNYTLTVLDNVGNKSTSIFTSDENGILVIEVEDEAYNFDGTALTFMLDNIQVNLYDGVEKHIRSVINDKVVVGADASIGIVTCDHVTMAQTVNDKGDTQTALEFIDNGDGTRTWYVIKKNHNVGEYNYGIRVKVDGKWIDEGKTATLTVIEKPAVSRGKVVDVDFTPVPGNLNTYEVKVEDRANMLQFIELEEGDGTGTRSYDRYSDKVVITSYDNEGNEVDSMSRTLAYEIWTVTTRLADGTVGVRVKERGSSRWEDMSLIYTFVNIYAEADSHVKSAELAAEWGKTGPVNFTIITGSEVQYVQLKNDAGSTLTISAEKATVNEDGTLTFTGKVWFNHAGDNTATVRILDANGWNDATVLYYYAEG